MSDLICPRCGKALTKPNTINLNVGAPGVEVCGRCHDYLKHNFDALLRFEKLQRNKENTEMPRPSKFTPEMDELLILAYNSNESRADIAEKLGVTPRYIIDRISYLKKIGAISSEPEEPQPESTTETVEERRKEENGSEIIENLIRKHRELLDEAARIETAIEMIGKYGG